MTITDTSPTLQVRLLSLVRQMDWFRGLRAAIALCVPLVVGDLFGFQIMGWAALGGFEATLADTGGPYRSRMASLATLSIGGATGLFLGCVAGRSLHWALPVTIAFCFLWSYLTVLGQPFSSAGLLVQVIYICGVGAPAASWQTALGWSVSLLGGGIWAAFLGLLLWPLDAYRPARQAVADCYNELASFLGSITDLASRERSSAALWHRLAQHHQYRIRRAVERGWEAVANIRADHQVDAGPDRQLVVLLEHADLLIARTIAVADHLEAQVVSAHGTPCFDRGLAGLADLKSAESWIAQLLKRRREITPAHARAQVSAMRRLPQYVAECGDPSDPEHRFLLAQITEAASLLEAAVESASILRLGQSPELVNSTAASVGHAGYVYERIGKLRQGPDWELLGANLNFRSLTLRHATRVALVCGLDILLILLFRIDHGYWLLLTSLVVLQPHVSGTLRRGLERIGGTVGGGILAAILAMVLHSQLVTAAVLFPLALLSLAILPISYAAFVLFLTPAFVLAWLPWSGDWQLALVRTLNTLAGAIIAVLAMLFLFPVYERDRAPVFLRVSLSADRRYLEVLSESWRSRSRSSRLLANARRAAGLAHNDSEESLERLLAETWPRRLPFAQFATAFVTYLRRFAQSVTTLTTLDGDWEWKQSLAVQSRLDLLTRRIQWLERHLETGESSSGSWPKPGTLEIQPGPQDPDHPGERQLERLERQSEILRRQLQSLLEHGGFPGASPHQGT